MVRELSTKYLKWPHLSTPDQYTLVNKDLMPIGPSHRLPVGALTHDVAMRHKMGGACGELISHHS
ncbi:hypothetical protein HYPGJ_31217 [Hyphomicrobium sp. GJ21]|nr:hypothetical protein HYPGJ_31217 [Hyphomicrobium sp. GJ21]